MRYRIGLPKGRLQAAIASWFPLDWLEGKFCGTLRFDDGGLDILLLKARDIPRLIDEGILDIGIAPTEWVRETSQEKRVVQEITDFRAQVCVLAPRGSLHLPEAPVRVATEFPRIARDFLGSYWPEVNVITVSGSAEAFANGLVDLIVDVVETGSTAALHGLEIWRVLFESRLCVLSSIPDWPQVISHARVEAMRLTTSTFDGRVAKGL